MTDLERINKIMDSGDLKDRITGSVILSLIVENKIENCDKDNDDDLLSLIENEFEGKHLDLYDRIMEFLEKHNLFPD